MSEDKFRDIDLLFGMHSDRNALAVVLHADRVGSWVDFDAEGAHVGVALLVVGSIDEDLVKNLEQTRHKGDLAGLEAGALVINEHALGELLNRADVCVGAQQDMFELCFLHVHVLNGGLALVTLPKRLALHLHVGHGDAVEESGLGE